MKIKIYDYLDNGFMVLKNFNCISYIGDRKQT